MGVPNPLTDDSRWTALDPAAAVSLAALRRTSVTDVLAGIEDPALMIAMRRPHWHLSTPALDTMWIVERPEGGRHREDRAGMWFPWEEIDVPKSDPTFVGRHACRCAGKHESVTIASAFAELDGAAALW